MGILEQEFVVGQLGAAMTNLLVESVYRGFERVAPRFLGGLDGWPTFEELECAPTRTFRDDSLLRRADKDHVCGLPNRYR